MAQENADISQAMQKSATTFLSLVDTTHLILVIGSGAGDIMDKFAARGYHVIGLEEDEALCKESREKGREVIQGSLHNIASIKLPKEIGGIFAGAAFAHTSRADLEHTLEVIHLMLPKDGALFLSVPKGQGEVFEEGHLTQYYTEEELKKVLNERYFQIVLMESSTPTLLTAVATR